MTSASLMPLTSRREQRIAWGESTGGLRPGRRSAWSGPEDSRNRRTGPGRGGGLGCGAGAGNGGVGSKPDSFGMMGFLGFLGFLPSSRLMRR